MKILLALFVTTSVALLSFGCSDSNSGASSYCQNSGESVPTELDGYLMGLDVESGSGVLCGTTGVPSTGVFSAGTYTLTESGPGTECNWMSSGGYTYTNDGYSGTVTLAPDGDSEVESGTLEFCGIQRALSPPFELDCEYRLTVRDAANNVVGTQEGTCGLEQQP